MERTGEQQRARDSWKAAEEKNQRVRLTRQLLREALLILMEKRDIRKISIRELCAKAGVNRTTFYNHYGSQYEVLDDVKERYIEDIEQLVDEMEPGDSGSALKRGTLVLQYMEDNLFLSRMLMNNRNDDSIIVQIFDLPRIGEMLQGGLAAVREDYERESLMEFVRFGCFGLLRSWLDTPDRAGAEEEMELMIRLARSTFEEIME